MSVLKVSQLFFSNFIPCVKRMFILIRKSNREPRFIRFKESEASNRNKLSISVENALFIAVNGRPFFVSDPSSEMVFRFPSENKLKVYEIKLIGLFKTHSRTIKIKKSSRVILPNRAKVRLIKDVKLRSLNGEINVNIPKLRLTTPRFIIGQLEEKRMITPEIYIHNEDLINELQNQSIQNEQ